MVKMHRHTFTLKYNFTKFVLKEVFWLWEFTFTQSNILFEGTVDFTELDETCMSVCSLKTMCFIQLQYGITIITVTCVFNVSIERKRENRRIYLQESLEEKKIPSMLLSLSMNVCGMWIHETYSITNYRYLHLSIFYVY